MEKRCFRPMPPRPRAVINGVADGGSTVRSTVKATEAGAAASIAWPAPWNTMTSGEA